MAAGRTLAHPLRLGAAERAEKVLTSTHLRKLLYFDPAILLPGIFPMNLGEQSDERKGGIVTNHILGR